MAGPATAALGTMAYGLRATEAAAAAPSLARLTLATVSPLTRPAGVNSVPAKVTVSPYVLEALLAVIVRAFWPTSIVTEAVTTLKSTTSSGVKVALRVWLPAPRTVPEAGS